MPRLPAKRLLNQLGTPFFVSVVLVLVILAVSTAIAYQSERREMRRVPETVALGAADGISSFFGFLEDTLRLAVGVHERQVTITQEGDQLLQTIVDENITLLELRLYDYEGDLLSEVSDSVLSSAVVAEDQFTARKYVDQVLDRGQAVLFEPELSQYNTAFAVWGFPVDAPGAGGERVLLAIIDVSSLWGVLAEISQTRPGNFYIVDEDGTILVASSFDLLGENKSAREIDVVEDFVLGQKETRIYDGLNGEEVFGTWEAIPPTTWALVVEFPSRDLARDISKSVLVFSIFLIVLVVFFAYEAIIVRRVLLMPLGVLVKVIDGFKAGNLRDRISGVPDNELGELAETFNHMADELEASYTGLEGKVAEKTKELREALARVKEQAEQLEADKVHDQAVFDSVGDGLVFMDQERRVVSMNKTALKLLGGEFTHYEGELWPEVVKLSNSKGEPVPQPEIPIVQALERQETVTVLPVLSDFTMQDYSGQYFPVSMTASPVLLEGNIIGAVVAFRNTTVERAIDRQKNEFISFASHQLRTPLTNIKWVAELLLKGAYDPLTEKQDQAVRNLEHVTKQMVSLVSTLLNLSRIELGTVITKPEPTDVAQIVREVVAEFERELVAKGLEMKLELEEAPATFITDGKLLQIVVQNLVSNAVKYTDKGSVTIRVIAEAGRLAIQVSDTGYGIPKSSQGKIFTKLFRAGNTSQRVQGTGLGLYMVNSIVELLGGEISFVSEEDKGTTFKVALPETVESVQQKVVVV